MVSVFSRLQCWDCGTALCRGIKPFVFKGMSRKWLFKLSGSFWLMLDTGPHRPSDTCYISRALLDCGGLTLTEHTHADIAQGHLFCVVSKQYCGFREGCGCGFCCIPQWSNSSRPHKKVQWCLVYYTWTKTDPGLIWLVNIKYPFVSNFKFKLYMYPSNTIFFFFLGL